MLNVCKEKIKASPALMAMYVVMQILFWGDAFSIEYGVLKIIFCGTYPITEQNPIRIDNISTVPKN